MSNPSFNKIDNGLLAKVDPKKLASVQARAIPDSRIRLCSTLMTPSREIVPIAEALVAYDPTTDKIIKFISAFIPQHPRAKHHGAKYLISKDRETGEHKSVVISHDGERREGSYWNPHFLTAFLDYSKLPMSNENAEFRVFRAYRAGIRAAYRFELLNFSTPLPGEDVDKHTMRVECPYNSIPPIELARCYKSLFWWQKQIVQEFSAFSGVDLSTALGLGIKYKIDEAVRQGKMSEATAKDVLHDHSEDPPEGSEEPLSKSFGVTGMVAPEEGEGKEFYVPENPLAKTVLTGREDEGEGDEKNEEETVEFPG